MAAIATKEMAMSKVQTIRGMATVSFLADDVKTQEKVMTKAPQLKGSALYFPSIEKTYGEPITHWMAVLKQAGEPAQDNK